MKTTKGIGTDIIEIERIKKAYKHHGERFLDHLFTHREKEYCHRFFDPSAHLAGRFAAKEAVLKALGTGLQAHIGWQEIEIINDVHGKPEVHIAERLFQLFPSAEFLISISHCQLYATATVLLLEGV